MIPMLFESTYPNTSRTFSGHGLGDLIDATEVVAEENAEDGHEWELTFNYPVTGNLFNEIALERIVVAKANSYQPLQAFRIYSITKNINQTISVACQHITYDLANIPVKPMKVIGAGPALINMKANMIDVCNKNNFIFSTNIPTPTPGQSSAEKKDVTIEFEEPRSALKVLLDGDDSIHGKYGGDVIVDNYDISLLSIGGSDRGVEITYGVDLVDLDQERNISNMVTGILPYYVRAKDTRLDVDLDQPSTTAKMQVNASMANTANGYILEAGSKYKVTFTPENSGGSAKLTAAAGFGERTFSMDGNEKEYEITPQSDISVPVGTSLISCVSLPEDGDIGSIRSFTIVKNYIEPIIYGSLTSGSGVYNVPKISSVDLTEYFQDSNDEPTVAQIDAKAAQWVAKEKIGEPEVSLTVSYASLEGKDIRLHDAIRVRFPKIGVDVTSKVTRYKYDVLAERCVDIDVGKTKDSAIFTLQDASKLRKGLLPPDRIGKESVSGDKIKKGSIGSGQIGAGAISKWNMPNGLIDKDLLGEKAVGINNLKTDKDHPPGWHDDPVLQSVPENVYGGYHRNIGYLLDPSLGMPYDGLPGWTDSNNDWHPIMNPYDRNIQVDNKSGVGYVMNPDCIANNTITTPKINDNAITGPKIADSQIDKDKFNTRTRTEWDTIATKTTNFGHLIGPQMAINVSSDYYAIESLAATTMHAAFFQVDGLTGYLVFPQQTGQTTYRAHAIYNTSSSTPIGYFISNTDITLPPDLSSSISRIDASLTSLSADITNLSNYIYGYDSGGTHYQGLSEIVWQSHEPRIQALENR